MKSSFSVIPIGGVKEIGSNMTLFKLADEAVLVDAGILFPYDDFFDLNYLIPDLSFLDNFDIKHLIITHGHEDHVGAIHHLIERFPNIQIWSPLFASKIIQKKFDERKISDKKINLYRHGDILKFDKIEIAPFQVNHSIPDTYGLCIKDKMSVNSFIYISDFKIDEKVEFEPVFDYEYVNNLTANYKNIVAMIDSTNVLNPGKTLSETEVVQDLESILDNKNQRIFITLFASNIHRLRIIFEKLKKQNQKVAILGRSLHFYINAAFESQHLDSDFSELIVDEDQLDQIKPNIFLVSGCQGDFLSALRRLSDNEFSKVKIAENDLIVFSSKVIPGNEKKISRIINRFYELGAKVITAYEKQIHASGHPGLEDLKIFYSKLNLTHAIPIHGESYFLNKHKDFLTREFPHLKNMLVYNYHQISFNEESYKIKELEPKELWFVHGKDIYIERNKISERRKMACQGLVSVTIDKQKPENIRCSFLGLPESLDKAQIESLIFNSYQELKNKKPEEKEDQIKIEIRRYFNNFLGYKPVTIVHII